MRFFEEPHGPFPSAMQPSPAQRIDSRPAARRRGFAFAELVVVMAVMLVAVSIFSSTVVSTARQRNINRENAIAADAARTAIELMRNEDFDKRYALFNPDPMDDPDGPGTAPGALFAVPGLNVIPGTLGNMAGRIELPVVDTSGMGGPFQLREDVVDPEMGLPRDLSGDSVVDSADHALDYMLLPVRVTIEWQGVTGRRRFQMFSLLVDFGA
jgi:type II secretory pathway pseudopilin PulG